ncbi:hypothetical protein K7I13_01335 [Brucepastera parasyntrophica]|uniref:hypothetical protein n=1 Tax=Brucepastera parasyntrophica TaxID=2880008 RepID=UPI002108A7BD|nr:hypothetical protein [Brucepastera parasyntrophica]ULQ60006.1 hypothetical protein K7I13_01335 [Brucepastera parasyntrophica]
MTSDYENNDINDDSFDNDLSDITETLDMYGVWVKSGPRDVDEDITDPAGIPIDTGLSDSDFSELPDFDDSFDTSETENGMASAETAVPPEENELPETAPDSVSDSADFEFDDSADMAETISFDDSIIDSTETINIEEPAESGQDFTEALHTDDFSEIQADDDDVFPSPETEPEVLSENLSSGHSDTEYASGNIAEDTIDEKTLISNESLDDITLDEIVLDDFSDEVNSVEETVLETADTALNEDKDAEEAFDFDIDDTAGEFELPDIVESDEITEEITIPVASETETVSGTDTDITEEISLDNIGEPEETEEESTAPAFTEAESISDADITEEISFDDINETSDDTIAASSESGTVSDMDTADITEEISFDDIAGISSPAADSSAGGETEELSLDDFLDDFNADGASSGGGDDLDLDDFIDAFNDSGGITVDDQNDKLFSDSEPVDLELEFDEDFIAEKHGTEESVDTLMSVAEDDFFDLSEIPDMAEEPKADGKAPAASAEVGISEDVTEFDDLLDLLDETNAPAATLKGQSAEKQEHNYDLNVTEEDKLSSVSSAVSESSDEDISVPLFDSKTTGYVQSTKKADNTVSVVNSDFASELNSLLEIVEDTPAPEGKKQPENTGETNPDSETDETSISEEQDNEAVEAAPQTEPEEDEPIEIDNTFADDTVEDIVSPDEINGEPEAETEDNTEAWTDETPVVSETVIDEFDDEITPVPELHSEIEEPGSSDTEVHDESASIPEETTGNSEEFHNIEIKDEDIEMLPDFEKVENDDLNSFIPDQNEPETSFESSIIEEESLPDDTISEDNTVFDDFSGEVNSIDETDIGAGEEIKLADDDDFEMPDFTKSYGEEDDIIPLPDFDDEPVDTGTLSGQTAFTETGVALKDGTGRVREPGALSAEPLPKMEETENKTEEKLAIPEITDYNEQTESRQDNSDTEEHVSLDFDDIGALERDLHDDMPEEEETMTSNDKSTELLMVIAEELSSIKKEISTLKTELANQRPAPLAEPCDPDQGIAENGESSGFFSDDDSDETIALTGDELNNILITADFTEEKNDSAEAETPDESQTIVSESAPSEENEPDLQTNLLDDTFAETDLLAGESGPEEGDPSFEENEFLLAEPEDNDSEGSIPMEEADLETIDFADEELEEPVLDDFNLDIPDIQTEAEADNEATDDDLDELDKINDISDITFDFGNLELEDDGETSVTETHEAKESLPDDPAGEELLESPEMMEEEIVLPAETDMPADAVTETQEAEESIPADLSGEESPETDIVPSVDAVMEIPDMPVSEDSIDILSVPAEQAGEQIEETVPAEPPEIVPEDAETESEKTLVSDDSAPSGVASLPGELKDEIKSVLSYMDQLLESLPEEKIEEFARSEHFEVYKKLFDELGIS